MASSAGDSAEGRSGEGSDGDALAVNRAWPAAACAGGSAHCGELDERGHRQGAGRRLQGNPCPMPCCLDYSARDPESSYSLSHISCVSPLSGLATYCYTPPILQPCRRCSHKPYSLPLVASNIPLQRDSLLPSQAVTALPTGPHLAALWAVASADRDPYEARHNQRCDRHVPLRSAPAHLPSGPCLPRGLRAGGFTARVHGFLDSRGASAAAQAVVALKRIRSQAHRTCCVS
jgi:hypothetical protein